MILARETKKKFGYWPKNLSLNSHKLIVIKCPTCNKKRETIKANLIKMRTLKCKSCSKFNDIQGKAFGAFIVQNESKIVKGHRHWKVKCKCGVIKFVSQGPLTRGRISSCSISCIYCPKYKGYKCITGTYWGSIINGAKQRSKKGRSLKVCMSVKDAYSILEKQNFLCAFSGRPLMSINGKFIGSFDRIDSDANYSFNNTQWVLKGHNWSKGDKTDHEYYLQCLDVVSNYNRSKS